MLRASEGPAQVTVIGSRGLENLGFGNFKVDFRAFRMQNT